MIVLDIIGPLVVFQVAIAAGVSEVWALVLSGLTPVIAVAVSWVRWRSLEIVGAVVLGGIALSVLLALLSNNPQVVLLEGTVLTFAFGVASLVSLVGRRPLIFSFAQVLYGGQHAAPGRELDTDYDTYPEARSFWRTLAVVWGVVYMAEAGVRVAIIFGASTQTSLLVTRVLPWVVYAALMLFSLIWGLRLNSTKPKPADPLAANSAKENPHSEK